MIGSSIFSLINFGHAFAVQGGGGDYARCIYVVGSNSKEGSCVSVIPNDALEWWSGTFDNVGQCYKLQARIGPFPQGTKPPDKYIGPTEVKCSDYFGNDNDGSSDKPSRCAMYNRNGEYQDTIKDCKNVSGIDPDDYKPYGLCYKVTIIPDERGGGLSVDEASCDKEPFKDDPQNPNPDGGGPGDNGGDPGSNPGGDDVKPGSSITPEQQAKNKYEKNHPDDKSIGRNIAYDDLCEGTECAIQNPIINRINTVFDFVSAGVGVIITIMIMIGGFQYMTAGGDPQKVSAAKAKIANAIIALVAYMFFFAFVSWLIPGGLI